MVDGVTRRYEITATWDVLNDIISSNVSDPRKTGDWIKNGFPNPADFCKKNGFEWPLVVIEMPSIPDSTLKTVDGTKFAIIHNIKIICYNKTRLLAAQLSEEIKNVLEVDGQSELIKAALHGPDIIGSSVDSEFIGTNKYYGYTIDYQFKRFD